MEALFLNPKNFDSILNIIENFAKEIFSGNDENRKSKLSKKLQNILDFNHQERNFNSVQNLDVSFSQNAGLPDEIWLKIIQYLPTNVMFGNFALTCKKLNNLTLDSRAIKYLRIKTSIKTRPKYENISKIIANSKGLIELKILKDGDFDSELICQVFESNPKLKSLSIKSKDLKAEAIDAIIKSKIEFLDLGFEFQVKEFRSGSDILARMCNIKTLKSLHILATDENISTLANNSIPYENLNLISDCVPSTILDNLFESKKDTLKKIRVTLQKYNQNIPLKNLNVCQKLEVITIYAWHSKNLEIFSGLPKLKKLSLIQLNAKVDNLVALFRRLSLKKLEYLSIQFCDNAREEFFVELAKLDFPALKYLHIHQSWIDRKSNKEKNLTDNTLQTLVSQCPNLRFIQFADNFSKSELTFKTLMEIFEKRNVFIIFGEIYTQLSMEKWFMNRNQELYEKYQKLKYRLTWKLEA